MKPTRQMVAGEWIRQITEPVRQQKMRDKEIQLLRMEAGPLRAPLDYPWNRR